ncbi:MAG: hypothetical protein A3G20_02775 [Acidobacteria bacterium RIFCSPLOWO2_12_FULL_59_11]|nr:MAG: hypothetical protein A3G20_02775 [Acidobacteria bacterium RIFCSPLOWO2_12_FULL_59_11]
MPRELFLARGSRLLKRKQALRERHPPRDSRPVKLIPTRSRGAVASGRALIGVTLEDGETILSDFPDRDFRLLLDIAGEEK